MKPNPVTITPKIMTLFGPKRSSATPTNGEMSPLSPR